MFRQVILRFVSASLFILIGIVAAAPLDAQTKKPNIIVVFSDDQGYGDVGCYGCPDIKTPVLDKLAASGVRLTNYYANGPECSPTRTALLTGRYQQRVGGLECAIGLGNVGRYDDAIRLANMNELGLPTSEITIVELLRAAGYATGLVGKWHLGYEDQFSPNRHGFDHFFGCLGGAVDYFHHSEPGGDHMLFQNGKRIHRDGYMTEMITDQAVKFIQKQKKTKPFFLYVAYTAPHSPYQRPGQRNAKPTSYEDFNKGTREDYVVMVEAMDKGIGCILHSLQKQGFADNTLVIFASDNGGATRVARNAPFRGGKGGLFEGGVHVPCIISWPGRLPKGKSNDQVCITMDLSSSIVRVAGANKPKDHKFDGIDIIQHLVKGKKSFDRTLFWRAKRGERTWRAVRDGSMKYVSRVDGDKKQEYVFNLAKDIGEKNNLLKKQPAEANRLRQLLSAWEKEVQPER